MTKFFIVKETESSSPYALVIHSLVTVKSYPLVDSANEWSQWVNDTNHSVNEIVNSLGLDLESTDSQTISLKNLSAIKDVLPDKVYEFVKTLSHQSSLEFTDNVRGYGRRYVVKSDIIERKRHQGFQTKSANQTKENSTLKRQSYIDHKAATFRADNTFSELVFNVKAARAMWDPDLGPSGGWRCPAGSRYGGYITDRFGRGCGGGIIRRVGRALVNAGRGLDNLADRRDRRRLNRAAERAAKPGGGRGRERAARAARGLERGARRILEGEELQADVANRRVRRNIDRPRPAPERGRVNLPGGGQGVVPVDRNWYDGRGRPNPEAQREREGILLTGYETIDEELQSLQAQLDNFGYGKRRPSDYQEIKERIRQLEAAKRKLGGGAKPPPAKKKREQRDQQNQIDDFFRRLRDEQNNSRPQRRPGSRPVRRPVTENRGRRGEVERRVRPRGERGEGQFAPGWKPGEYRPGDKDRIAQRENRYAKVSTDQLYRALEMHAPRDLKPGESADVEARRRQERLEILQELINRDLDIPERYKREAKIYRLKKQRKQGAKPKRNERVARALERVARRIVGGEGGRSREERRQRRAERRSQRRAERRERAARRLERGAERLVGEEQRRPRSQRERARSAVVEQAERSPVRKPQRKRRDAAFDALAGKDELDDDFRQLLLGDFNSLAEEWGKRLGGPITREAMDKYIADREGIRPPAFVGSLKAKANDWDVLRDYFKKELDADLAGKDMTGEERLAILEKLGPTRKRKLRERMAANIPAPKSRSERTPSRPATPVPSRPRTPSARVPSAIPQESDIPEELKPEFDVMKYVYGDLADVLKDEYGVQVALKMMQDIEINARKAVDEHGENLKNARIGDRRFDPDNRVQYGPNAWENLPFIPDFPSEEEVFDYRDALQERIREVGEGVVDARARFKSMSPTQRSEHMREEAMWVALMGIQLKFNADRQRRQAVHLNQLDAVGARRAEQIAKLGAEDVERVVRQEKFGINLRDSNINNLSASELKRLKKDVDNAKNSYRKLIIELEANLSVLAENARDANGLVRNPNDPALNSEEYIRRYAKLKELKKVEQKLVNLEKSIERADKLKAKSVAPSAPPPANGLDSRTPVPDQVVPIPGPDFAPSNIISGRNGRVLPDRRLANFDDAVEHIYVNGGKLEDVPDEVIIRAMLHKAVDVGSGDEIDLDNALENGFPGDKGWMWENDRFSGELIKPNYGPPDSVWEVHRVTDKKTGDVWYFKTSSYGDFDAANELLGAAMAEGLGFGLGLEHVRFGEEVDRKGKPGRWMLMRDIADMDHGPDVPQGATWKDLENGRPRGLGQNVVPEDAARAAIMDYVLHNLDRHGGNIMVTEDVNGNWRIGIIDNGLIGGGRAPDADFMGLGSMSPEEFIQEIIDRDISPGKYGGWFGEPIERFNNAIQTLKNIYSHQTSEREQQFREQAQKAVEQLRKNLAGIISKKTLEANGAKLSQAEIDYISMLEKLVSHRLDKLESGGLDELVGMF